MHFVSAETFKVLVTLESMKVGSYSSQITQSCTRGDGQLEYLYRELVLRQAISASIPNTQNTRSYKTNSIKTQNGSIDYRNCPNPHPASAIQAQYRCGLQQRGFIRICENVYPRNRDKWHPEATSSLIS